MDFDIESATTKAPHLPDRILMYGTPGVGKTSMAAQFRDPIFLMSRGETGVQKLIDKGDIEPVKHFPKDAQTWEDVIAATKSVLTKDHDRKTFVVDTANGCEMLLRSWVVEKEFNGDDGDKGYGNYGAGTRRLREHWRNYLALLDEVNKRGIGVVLIAHSKVSAFKNPLGSDYDQYQPDMDKQIWPVTCGWADMVWFIHREVETAQTDKRAKADSTRLVLHAEDGPAWNAKRKGSMPAKIVLPNTAQGAYEAIIKGMKGNAK